MTAGTASALPTITRVQHLSCHRPLTIGGIDVQPYPVPHDAREPCQFTFAAGGRRLGMLTDAGHVTPHMVERLTDCDALALECNHDLESLQRGPYPDSLKARVASRFGHLNNHQTTELLQRLDATRVQWVLGLHLSERNNSPEHVRAALQPALENARYPLHLATPGRADGVARRRVATRADARVSNASSCRSCRYRKAPANARRKLLT